MTQSELVAVLLLLGFTRDELRPADRRLTVVRSNA